MNDILNDILDTVLEIYLGIASGLFGIVLIQMTLLTIIWIFQKRRKCEGTEFVEGCGKKIKSTHYTQILIFGMYSSLFMINLLILNFKKASKMLDDQGDFSKTLHLKSIPNLKKDENNSYIEVYSCTKCWDLSESIKVMNILGED